MRKTTKGAGWPALWQEMQAASINPRELAEQLGINRVTVYKWLRIPGRKPDMERVPALARALAGDSPERARRVQSALVDSMLYPATPGLLSPASNPLGEKITHDDNS